MARKQTDTSIDLSSVDVAAEVSQKEAAQEETKDIKTIVQDSPISRALNTILEYAVKSRASDIHIESFEKALKIRCRVDGVCGHQKHPLV